MPPRIDRQAPTFGERGRVREDTVIEAASGLAPAEPEPWKASFWSLIVTQFQGAFSDSALKNLIIFLILRMGLPTEKRDSLIPLILFLFALPFVLFSMTGGFLADRFSKRSVTIGTKVMELGVVLLAATGLALPSLPVQAAAVFLLSTQAALFGPSKYGLLPELLPEKLLSWGNGILELGTFLAIILGTVSGALMAEAFRGRQGYSGAIFVGLAALGLLASLGIRRVPAANPGSRLRLNFLGALSTEMREMRKDRVLALAVAGNVYFWFLGAILQPVLLLYGSDVLHLRESQGGVLQATLAVGIGLGSLAAGYLSGNKIEYGLVPLGSLGITVFALMLSPHGLTFGEVAVRLALLGVFAGFFAVPVNAMIQHRPAAARRGAIIAAAGLLSWIGVFLAAGVYWLLVSAGRLSPPSIVLASALLTLAATVYVLRLLPDALLRLLLWLLTHTFYRIRIEGRDNIPEKGGALFVSNHLSFVDALLLSASTDRPVRFLIYQAIYDHPLVKPFARTIRAIPVSSDFRPRDMIRALRVAGDAVQAGEVVCIFAEGQITRIGALLPFRRGFERIMKGVDAPIVPVALEGVWGSIFSFEKGRFFWKIPHRIPFPVTVSFGRPMPAGSTHVEVREAVQALQTEAWASRRRLRRTLHRAFVASARRHPLRFAMADGKVPKLRYGAALARTIFLARRLRPVWEGQEKVGILLPPSVGGALVNFAALLTGKVPVNLNYTASDEVLQSCARQCGLETVVTAKAFLDRLEVRVPGRTVLLEDLAAHPRAREKLWAVLLRLLAPAGLLERALGRRRRASLDDLATVIFSSGSTGDPKGVMLTHDNVGSNIEQIGQIFSLGGSDRILGVLPFFHSFGFTGTLCLPAALGSGVVYHPSPLDARAIGGLVRTYGVTFLLATPTFLQGYIRRCQPEDFGSLRFVMVGAEKLSERISVAFEDRFGLRPFEAYGCTECSPAVAVNRPDYRAAGFRQVGAKRGSIGHPLPGISVKIVDPATLLPLPVGQPGLLVVRGPNVMKGYLGRPDKTAEVLRDGWYVTGDVAELDPDGFLVITDRLSRFSKIGGEMVPHIKVEEKLQEVAGATEQVFAVTGVPDERKGERLVVLHTLPEEKLAAVLEALPKAGLSNLWTPRVDQFHRVDALPLLGSGKLDLRKIRELAAQFGRAS
ncbi:MAG: MFS transporter [Acidobacteriia bacterium]|nr:MFS transporter [Terriglobia bacterium]